MSLVTPKLDDRKFQDIVDEAKKRIPHYIREWTDHNVSDPGVTLIELFAWMTDMILYRLNQVPELHYIKLLETLGIRLNGPEPARVPVTFWLSAPQETKVVIPAGTEVASMQTETERSIVFTTDEDFRIQPPELDSVLTRVASSDRRGKRYHKHSLSQLDSGFKGFDIFTPDPPQRDDAIYFGFENDLSHHLLGLDIECDSAGGAGVNPNLPPYVWEASTGGREDRWQSCEVDSDTTKALNHSGRIKLFLPKMGKISVNNKSLFWVRLRIREITEAERQEGVSPYSKSPKMSRLSITSWGCTIGATHAQQVMNEFLGRSDGSTGQRFHLQRTPVLARKAGEQLMVKVEGTVPQKYSEVADFADSGAYDRHYTLDSVSGEIRLGPAVRQQDGTVKLYGAVPPREANLVFSCYRHGGGQEGNVQRGILRTLKTSIPFVARVSNRKAAEGGLDAETLEAAMMRAPQLLRSRGRAVTESDFEFLAQQALPSAISRVKCLQPRPSEAGRVKPGQIYVLIIPRIHSPARYLEAAELQPDEADIARLSELLEERRLLTTRLDIRAPVYRWVTCKVQLRANPGVNPETVEAEVLNRLHTFLNPISGGPNGDGWPFGRDLFVSDVYQCLQGLPNVQFIRGVEMRAATAGGPGEGAPVEMLEVLAHGVIASARHEVEFV